MICYKKYIQVLELLQNETEFNDQKLASAICDIFDIQTI